MPPVIPLRAVLLGALAAVTLPGTPLAAQSPNVAAPPPASAAPATPALKPAPERHPEDAATPFNRNANRHKIFLYRAKQGDVGLLFLGDSIMDFWPRTGEYTWMKYAPYKPADFAVSGERTEDVLYRVENGELEGIHPKVAVIMIGTNNVGAFPTEEPAWVVGGIKKIVDTVHAKLPDTKVLLLGVFPRASKADPRRIKADEINRLLATTDLGPNTRFLDINAAFLDKDGNVPASVFYDGLHPGPHGYELWYDAMKGPLDEMMK